MTYTVLGTVLAIGFAVCTGFAQSTITTPPSAVKQIAAEPQTTGLSDGQPLTLRAGFTGDWPLEGDAINPATAPPGGPQNESLLGSVHEASPTGAWTLVLADFASGQEGTVPQGAPVLSATPEPSTYALLGLGALLLIHHLRWRIAK